MKVTFDTVLANEAYLFNTGNAPSGLVGFMSWDRLALLLLKTEIRNNERLNGLHITADGITLALEYKQ